MLVYCRIRFGKAKKEFTAIKYFSLIISLPLAKKRKRMNIASSIYSNGRGMCGFHEASNENIDTLDSVSKKLDSITFLWHGVKR